MAKSPWIVTSPPYETESGRSAGEPSPAERLIDAISECVPEIGTDYFIEHFIHVVSLIGAGQVTAFAYEPGAVHCLLSRHFHSDLGGTLTAVYLDGGFRDDPLYERALELESGACLVQGLEDILPFISSQYLAMFRGCAGHRTKVAVLVAQGSIRMVLNLYFEGDVTERTMTSTDRLEVGLWRLLGRTLATHFLRVTPPEFPMPLAALSERERQVCIGMLAGKKAALIAAEIGVKPSSIVTYRQRAYQKLGVSSREQLFSLCRFWLSQQRQALTAR